MCCEDFFSMNKKIEDADCVAAILPGLKDMQAWDWIATHHNELIELMFAEFLKELRKEFLPENWDNDLHSHICNSRPKPSDNFAAWLNNICHMNIVLCGTDYHFSDDALCMQLESLLNTGNRAGKKMEETQLTVWISEIQKLAEECSNDTK